MYTIETREDANQLVSNSIVYISGAPVWVEAITGGSSKSGFTGVAYELPFNVNGEHKAVPLNLNDPAVQYDKFNVGYYNNRGQAAIYLERGSVRQYAQGLTAQQVRRRVFQEKNGSFGYDKFGFRDALYDPHFLNMLANKYPSFDEAAKKVKDGSATTLAFTRYLAVGLDSFRGDLILYYKGQRIGWSSDAINVMLPKDFQHLREILDNSKLKVQPYG